MLKSERYKHDKKRDDGKLLRIMFTVVIVLAFLVVLSIAGLYESAASSITLSFTEASPEVEFGGDFYALDYVAAAEGNVKAEPEMLETDSLGSREVRFTVTKPVMGGLLKPEKEFILKYEVVDTVPPLMILSGDGAVIDKGGEFDINKVISYGDNADPAPVLETDGTVDTGKPGSYPVHVRVTDASGNAAEWEFTAAVTGSADEGEEDSGTAEPVKEESEEKEEKEERLKFKKFKSKYGGEDHLLGIDVSAWQDEVDFEKVKDAGCDFVMIRIGYTSGGSIVADSRFDENYDKARAAGLRVGVCLCSTDKTIDQARASAAFVAEKLAEKPDGDRLDFPVAFDWEGFDSFQNFGMSFDDLNRLYDAFAAEIADAGYGCMLYSSRKNLDNIWYYNDTRQVWLAQYADTTDYEGSYLMWQASCSGRIKGVSGKVNLDVFFPDRM